MDLLSQATRSARDDIVELSSERFERRLAEETGRLRQQMAKLETRLIRWMFVFWVGQIGVLTGILFAFFRA